MTNARSLSGEYCHPLDKLSNDRRLSEMLNNINVSVSLVFTHWISDSSSVIITESKISILFHLRKPDVS